MASFGEVARVGGRGGAAVALERVGVHVLAADLPLVGQDLGHPELHPQPAVDLLEERRREGPGAAPGVGGQRARGSSTPRRRRWPGRSARPPRRRRRSARPAGTTRTGGRRWWPARLGQAGRHPGVAGHVGGLLAHLGDAAADDVVDPLGVDAGARHQVVRVKPRRSTGCQVARAPPRLPKVVRHVSTMTASRDVAHASALPHPLTLARRCLRALLALTKRDGDTPGYVPRGRPGPCRPVAPKTPVPGQWKFRAMPGCI